MEHFSFWFSLPLQTSGPFQISFILAFLIFQNTPHNNRTAAVVFFFDSLNSNLSRLKQNNRIKSHHSRRYKRVIESGLLPIASIFINTVFNVIENSYFSSQFRCKNMSFEGLLRQLGWLFSGKQVLLLSEYYAQQLCKLIRKLFAEHCGFKCVPPQIIRDAVSIILVMKTLSWWRHNRFNQSQLWCFPEIDALSPCLITVNARPCRILFVTDDWQAFVSTPSK